MMIVLFNWAQPNAIWDGLAKISTPWSLAAFALAIVLYLLMRTRSVKIPSAAWAVILLLVAIPVGASLYGNFSSTKALYRVRVTVVDPQGIPIEGAKVWSSFGGEPKRVAGGWQFDIPTASKPQDSKLSFFASKESALESAFLTGRIDLSLGNDYNPVVTIGLKLDASAKVRGQVVDEKHRAIYGVRVFVVGYESEAVLTKDGGVFELPTHVTTDQLVRLRAEKPGFKAANLFLYPAGDAPVIVVIRR
jgi:hypothetical protein